MSNNVRRARVDRAITRARDRANTLGELALIDSLRIDLLADIDDATSTLNCNGEREKGWMGTSTGRKFYPLSPLATDVCVHDIARGLAMTCRYGGQVRRYYSVAEHCVLVSHHVPAQWACEALFHDSAEAYIGDMIRPLKHQPEMKAFRDAEEAIERAVFEHLQLTWTPESMRAVKEVDNRILVNEIVELNARPSHYLDTPLLRDLEPLDVKIRGWEPLRAEAEFLARYEELFA